MVACPLFPTSLGWGLGGRGPPLFSRRRFVLVGAGSSALDARGGEGRGRVGAPIPARGPPSRRERGASLSSLPGARGKDRRFRPKPGGESAGRGRWGPGRGSRSLPQYAGQEPEFGRKHWRGASERTN